MSDTAVAKKPSKKGLEVSFGLLSMSGDLFSPAVAGSASKSSFHLACPAHPKTPHAVEQRYVCSETNEGSWKQGEVLRMRETATGNVIVPPDAITETKKNVSVQGLELHPHPYTATKTLPYGTAYIFRPAGASQLYGALLELVSENGIIDTETGPKMLIGEMSVKSGSITFVRVERWNGQLVLRELMRPEEIDETLPTDEVAVDVKQVALARQVIEAMSEEFDPGDYRNRAAEELDKLVALAAEGKVDVTPKAPLIAPVIDITAALEASLAAARAAKGDTLTKTTKKRTTKPSTAPKRAPKGA